MNDYQAPVDDILFTMNTVAGMQALAQLPAFEEASADLVEAIVNEAAKFSAGVIAPLNRIGDEQGSKVVNGDVVVAEGFAEAYQQVVAAGWSSLSGAPEFGGQGLPILVSAAVGETIMSANVAFSLVTMLSQGSISALTNHGSPALQEKYLPKLISGEWTGTMNLTEPQAGSDLGVVKTIATPHEDHYLISGQKIFITSGHGKWHVVIARTEADQSLGLDGLSLFLAEAFTEGEDGELIRHATVERLEEKLGHHASPTVTVRYDNSPAELVGEPGEGFKLMLLLMNNARISVGFESLGLMECAFRMAKAYTAQRHSMGKPIAKHELLADQLDEMQSDIEGLRALCVHAAWHEELHQRARLRLKYLHPEGDPGLPEAGQASEGGDHPGCHEGQRPPFPGRHATALRGPCRDPARSPGAGGPDPRRGAGGVVGSGRHR